MCDCCDGTDEHDGRTNCANTCVQAGAARRDAIRTKVHAAKGGVDRGRKIRDAAPALRRKWMDESATLEKDVAAQRAIVHDANVAKDVAEREESDATKAEDRLNKREAARNSSSSSTADEFTRRRAPNRSHTRRPRPRWNPGRKTTRSSPWTTSRRTGCQMTSRRTGSRSIPPKRRSSPRISNKQRRRRSEGNASLNNGSTEIANRPAAWNLRRRTTPPQTTPTDDANLTPEERKKRDMDRMIAEAARNQAIAEGAGGIPAGAYESNTDAIPDPEPATSMGEAAGDDADEEDLGEEDDETDDETDESGSGGGFFSSLFSGGKKPARGAAGRSATEPRAPRNTPTTSATPTRRRNGR